MPLAVRLLLGLLWGVWAMTLCTPTATAATKKTPQGQPSAVPARASSEPSLTVMENGLTVLVQPDDRFPLAAIRLYVHAGSAYEDPAKAGISHVLEHMVFKGTARRGPGQVAKDIEAVGGYLNAATSFDYTVYTMDVPHNHWALGLDVVHDMIYGATLDPKELESEKGVVLSELERGEDNPDNVQFQTIQARVFAGMSYRWPIIGFRDTVSKLTRDDVKGYIRAMYQPQRMLLVVVGQVDQSQVLAKAAELFGGLRNDHRLVPPEPVDLAGLGQGLQVAVRQGAWNKAYVTLAWPVPAQGAAAAADLEVLTQLLGGDRTSRLYRRFKYEERLVDEISAANLTLERAGLLLIQATLDADKVRPYLDGVLSELANLKAAAFTATELDRAKLNLEDSLFRSKETLSGLASKVGYFQFFENGRQGEENYLHAVRTMDPGRLDQAIAAWLRPERLTASLIVPQGMALEEQAVRELVQARWPQGQSAGAPAAAGGKGAVETVSLPQGSSLVLLPDATLPYTAVSLHWLGGQALAGAGKDGLAELAARVLTRGAGQRGAVAIQDFLADRAASVAASSTREGFSLGARYPSRFAGDIQDFLRDVALRPTFPAEEVDRARQEQLAEIKRREDEPTGLAFRRLFPFLFDAPGYGGLALGSPEQLSGYDAASLRAFWERQRIEPFVMSVCGQYDREAVVALARELATGLRGEAQPAFALTAPAWKSGSTLELPLPGRNQVHLVRIYPVAGESSAETPGLELLQQILAGQSGLLFRDLRDKQGLGYSVTAMLWQAPTTGFLAFYIGTSADKAEAALAGFDRTAAELAAKPLPKAELERAVNLLRGDYYRDHQSLGSRAAEASGLLVKGLPLDHTQELMAKAATLTPADIQALAAKYLHKDTSYLVTVKP